MTDSKQWLVMQLSGRIVGPYSTVGIQEMIREQILTGDEKISHFPDGDWIEMSSIPEFYDELFELLQDKPELSIKNEDIESHEATEVLDDETRKVDPPEPEVEEEIEEKIEEVVEPTRVIRRKKFDDDWAIEEKKKEIIEEAYKEPPEPKKKKSSVPSFILLMAIGLLFYGYQLKKKEKPKQKPSAEVRLILPKWPQDNRVSISKNERDKKMKAALSRFYRANLEDYLFLQNSLASLSAKDPNHVESLSILCLVYLELWPYTKKRAKDLAIIARVAQHISPLDPLGISASSCKVVQLYLDGNFDTAEKVIDSILLKNSNSAVYYELKSRVLEKEGQFSFAISYLQQAQQINNNWLKVFFEEARIRFQIQEYQNAATLFKNVLSSKSNHNRSLLYMAWLERFHFNNIEKSKLYLNSLKRDFLSLPPKERAMANYLQARDLYQKRNVTEALIYAEQAYKIEPENQSYLEFYQQLGGSDIAPSSSQANSLIQSGDILFNQGRYIEAQAEYKGAFAADPKSAVAAVKAAKSLWEINRGDEAIQWLKKAVKADSRYLDSYFLLGDYYSARYQFREASKILRRGQKKSKADYRILRAFALVEYRRNNFKAAIDFAQKAMALYDTDLQTHLILTRALQKTEQLADAYATSARAIELEQNNVEAQVLYASLLAQFQGLEIGIEYIKNKIFEFPAVIEYRIGLAEIYLNAYKYDLARDVLLQVVEYNRRNQKAYLMLGDVYREKQNLPNSLRAYLSAAEIDPSDALPLMKAGELYMGTRKFKQAVTQFQRALNANPNYPLLHLNLGRAYLEMGQTKKALEAAKKEKRKNPRLGLAYELSGDALIQSQQYAKAAGEYQKAISLGGKTVGMYVKMGRANRLLGNFEVAESMLQTASDIESGFAEIYKEFGALYEKKGQIPQAIEAYEKYIQLRPTARDVSIIQKKIGSLGG